jgi:hypothetical protein
VFRLDQIFKDYRESGALNEQINLFGFVSDEVFLTKTGDVGVVLSRSTRSRSGSRRRSGCLMRTAVSTSICSRRTTRRFLSKPTATR